MPDTLNCMRGSGVVSNTIRGQEDENMFNPGEEISSLDFGAIIGGSLNAVVKAQSQSAQTTVNYYVYRKSEYVRCLNVLCV